MADLTQLSQNFDWASVIASNLGISLAAATILLAGVVLWEFAWTAVAMWKSARNRHVIWFIVFFVFNLLAIPEIIYVAFFSRPRKFTEVPVKSKNKKRK